MLTSPPWYLSGRRASEGELTTILDFCDDNERDWDWRWVKVPAEAFVAKGLGESLEAFITGPFLEREEEEDREECADVEAKMRAEGAEQFLSRNPIAFILEPDSNPNMYSDGHAVGVAFHAFGLKEVPALVAVPGTNRHLPIEREPPWADAPVWSANAVDADGPRYEDWVSIRGDGYTRAIWDVIFGDTAAEYEPHEMKPMLANAQAWDEECKDNWVRERIAGKEFMGKAAAASENFYAAVEEVLEFLEECVEARCGAEVGPQK